ncbi:hypothetical protein SKAU_G00081300 [Synaphobranchus kaupii]|uniref:Uncharacterized protein n=1 Tax=Synaphobranchus kaupii TaxID=118154 RepID=A0A9Q1J4H9_SYNKA|nr:hypothetical protein SKAU_G00081300 [Synaphobranchus kaupii]
MGAGPGQESQQSSCYSSSGSSIAQIKQWPNSPGRQPAQSYYPAVPPPPTFTLQQILISNTVTFYSVTV